MDQEKADLPSGTARADIGRRLKSTRQSLGLKQIEVCRVIGIRQNTYSMNEAGASLPNIFDMIRFAEAFGVTLDWIYRGKIEGLTYDMARKVQTPRK